MSVLDPTFYWVLASIMIFDGLFMHLLTWICTHTNLRYRKEQESPIPMTLRIVNSNGNNLLALGVWALFFHFLAPTVLVDTQPSFFMLIWQVFIVLMLYDFFYYIFHRVMHYPKLMPWCHGVHHRVRSPTAGTFLLSLLSLCVHHSMFPSQISPRTFIPLKPLAVSVWSSCRCGYWAPSASFLFWSCLPSTRR